MLIEKLKELFEDRSHLVGGSNKSLYDCYSEEEYEAARKAVAVSDTFIKEGKDAVRRSEMFQYQMLTNHEAERIMERAVLVEGLRWKKFSVLDDGFVCLVDLMGSDSAIVQAARISYGADERPCQDCKGAGQYSDETAPFPDSRICETCNGSGKESIAVKQMNDTTLIRYLMRHRHTTPVEMVEIKFLVRVPMDTWRQWIRHRMASVNEYSTRYSEAIDSQQKTPADQWRQQSQSNKQGSSGSVSEWPEDGKTPQSEGEKAFRESGQTPGSWLSQREEELQRLAMQIYNERLDFGVAKEQARKDLPLSTYTEAYWKIDLHNLLHFLGLRMHSHAQKEIRDYATIIGEQIIKPLFPIAYQAFLDYHPNMNAMLLTALDIQVLQKLTDGNHVIGDMPFDIGYYEEEHGSEKLRPRPAQKVFDETIKNKREREECIAKLRKLGIVQ